jgi:hypothetical protein
VSFAVITLCVAPQRVFIVVVYFVMDSVRKLLDTLSYFVLFFQRPYQTEMSPKQINADTPQI